MSDTAEQQSAASEAAAEGSLLDQVMANSRMAPADEGYDVARRGVATTKTELLEDFEFAPDVTQTGFYKHIYSTEYGQFGGEPVGAVVGNYAFTPSTPDMKLLQYVSSVGAMAHAPSGAPCVSRKTPATWA